MTTLILRHGPDLETTRFVASCADPLVIALVAKSLLERPRERGKVVRFLDRGRREALREILREAEEAAREEEPRGR